MSDNINHPSHYTWIPGIECKDVAGHFDFNLGMAIKYIWRAGRKSGHSDIEDLQKAIACIQFEIERIEKFETKKCGSK